MFKYNDKTASADVLQQNFVSHIDTIQTKEPILNRERCKETKKGIKMNTRIDDYVKTIYNPNNYNDSYSSNTKLSETENIINKMMIDLTVIDIDAVEYKRIDIATDISYSFTSISKFLDLLHRCMVLNLDGKMWSNRDQNDLKDSNIRFNNRSLQIEFYDKYKESDGRASYPTRLEIRFKRISSKDLKLHVKNAIKLWRDVPSNLEEVEDKIIKLLKCLYVDELKSKKIANFNDFVCRYQERIFTRRILEELYKFTELKTPFKIWLSRYKENHNLTFYTKTEVKTFIKYVIKSLKNYIKK